jgi:hypothetical protein
MMKLNSALATVLAERADGALWRYIKEAAPPSVPSRPRARYHEPHALHLRRLLLNETIKHGRPHRTRPLQCVVVEGDQPHWWTKLGSELRKLDEAARGEEALEQGFFMDADADDLAAMDEYDRQADERFRAACERETRGLLYERG